MPPTIFPSRSLWQVKPSVQGITKIWASTRLSINRGLVYPYFGNALNLGLYPTFVNPNFSAEDYSLYSYCARRATHMTIRLWKKNLKSNNYIVNLKLINPYNSKKRKQYSYWLCCRW
jgi:hypothetical protein